MASKKKRSNKTGGQPSPDEPDVAGSPDEQEPAGVQDTAAPPAKPKVDLTAHKKRSERAWSDRAVWDAIYLDAYEFVIPYRRPSSRVGKGVQTVQRLFDSTAIESAFRAAGQLHQDLFAPGFWKLSPGPVAKAQLQPQEVDALAAALEQITNIASAFFQTGEFDMASAETCIDLLVGTGTLFPVEGDDENPIRWVCISFDEIALEVDAYGKVVAIFWKSRLSRRAIDGAFPNGSYPAAFTEALASNPEQEIEIHQDFYFDPASKQWIFCAHITESAEAIVTDSYRTQPMAVGRYHRVPGETNGRGPILLALPTIKTLNKAAELTLKSAAIQMLGIWGYRPGGTFNPDTARLAPGEFWPMQGTGGVLGPDVTRLDVSAGKIDVGSLITTELRTQIQNMLGDDKLPDKGATPVSATEIMARMKRIQQNYLGAYGRLVNEIIPVVVRRVLEILYRRKLIPQNINIDTLLIKVDVLSPIATAVKSAAHSRIIDFFQLVGQLKGPQAMDLICKVDDGLRLIGEDMVPPSLLRTVDEQKSIEATIQAAVAAIVKSQMGAQQPGAAAAAPAQQGAA